MSPRYKKLTSEQLEASRTESLKDAADRIMPFFESVIVPSMRAGNKCIIVCHANTIRTLVKNIDNISDEDIKGLSIPTGIPLLYRLNEDMKPVDPQIDLEFRYMVQPKGYVDLLHSRELLLYITYLHDYSPRVVWFVQIYMGDGQRTRFSRCLPGRLGTATGYSEKTRRDQPKLATHHPAEYWLGSRMGYGHGDQGCLWRRGPTGGGNTATLVANPQQNVDARIQQYAFAATHERLPGKSHVPAETKVYHEAAIQYDH